VKPPVDPKPTPKLTPKLTPKPTPKPKSDPPEATVPATVEVTVESTPPGAQVLRDGNVIGTTPLRLPMARGRNIRLELKLTGHAPKVITVNTVAATRQSVTLTPVVHNRGVNPF
jgi:hypothetical protein